MEVKINKDIREFSESIFFGRAISESSVHFFLIGLCDSSNSILYIKTFFWNRNIILDMYFRSSTFAVLGFVKYNGMTAEKFIVAFIKSEFITPKRLTFKSKIIYAEVFKPTIERNLKNGLVKPQHKHKEKKNKKPKKLKKEVDNNAEDTKKNI